MVFATPVTGPALLNAIAETSVTNARNNDIEAIIIDLFVSNTFFI
jgi:hypothetical protein